MATPKPTPEMVNAVYSRINFVDHDTSGIREGLIEAFEMLARDHQITPYCNAELMPGVACKLSAELGHRKHQGKTSTGNTVQWENLP